LLLFLFVVEVGADIEAWDADVARTFVFDVVVDYEGADFGGGCVDRAEAEYVEED
jgi:hypothetical protein